MSDVDDDIQEEVHSDDDLEFVDNDNDDDDNPEFVDNDDDPEFVDNDNGNNYNLWVQYYDSFAKYDSEKKECNSKNRGGPYYEYQQNDISILEPVEDHDFELRNLVWTTSKHDVYHLSNNVFFYYSAVTGNKSEVLDFSGTVAPVEKHRGNWLQGLTDTQVTTLAIKDKLLVAGGSEGELICKYIDRPGVSFCSRATSNVNAIMSCIEIYNSSSGVVHFTASNKGCVVRDFDVETFQLSKQLDFPWPVNHTSLSPDVKLLVVVGDSNDGLLVNLESDLFNKVTLRHQSPYRSAAAAPISTTYD